MVEVINSAFPLAWVFGRMGCSSVHDHPGHLSDAWFAAALADAGNGVVGRLDLGLMRDGADHPAGRRVPHPLERKPVRPLGFYTGWMCVAYAPVRFLLDFFRETEGDSPCGRPALRRADARAVGVLRAARAGPVVPAQGRLRRRLCGRRRAEARWRGRRRRARGPPADRATSPHRRTAPTRGRRG